MLGQRRSPLLVQCRSIIYDVGPTLKSITGSAVYFAQTRGIHPMLFQCRPTVFHAGPTLKQHWVIVPCFLTAALIVCGWRFPSWRQKRTDNKIHWPNADVMLGHRLRRWANIIPTKTIWALNIIFNRECIFSEHFLKTKVLNLGISNVIFDMFIRTGVGLQKCPPHTQHPSFP